MRTKPGLLVASLAGAAALTVGVGGALASGGGGTCTSKLTNSNCGPSGTMSGRIHCSKPAGRGKSHWTYSSTLAPGKGGMSLNLVYKGKFKDKFGKGTIHGSFNMSGAVLPPQGMTFTMTG